MTIQLLTEFFKWCSILGGGLFTFWAAMIFLAPDYVYKTQFRWFPIQKDIYTVTMYKFMGFFKIILLLFFIIPYVALRLII